MPGWPFARQLRAGNQARFHVAAELASVRGAGAGPTSAAGSLLTRANLHPRPPAHVVQDGHAPGCDAITPASAQSFGWTESDAAPSATTTGTDNIMRFDFGVFWEDISTIRPTSVADTGNLFGRCDTLISATDGCVNENYTPIVTYSAIPKPAGRAGGTAHLHRAEDAFPLRGGSRPLSPATARCSTGTPAQPIWRPTPGRPALTWSPAPARAATSSHWRPPSRARRSSRSSPR